MTTKLLLAMSALCIHTAFGQKKLDKSIGDAIGTAQKQYAFLATQVEPGAYPKTFVNGKLETSDSGWWCSGFYPGTLLYLDEAKPNPQLKKEALDFLSDLKKEQFNKTTHDLGFMMFCSFANAERLTPKPEYEQILMNSAKSLSTRFNEKAGCIRSWDSAPWNKAAKDEMPVIIDNMMNLELLFWATRHSGDSTYYKIATRHADTTMKNHFRPDYSSYHVVVYGLNDGKVHRQITNQGAFDESAWARGQAWGLYGYTLMYRETKDKKYLQQAQHIADFILNQPNLPKDKVPFWDFNAPGVPNALRDSSAGAIIASALLELSKYSDNEKSKTYFNSAETMLATLLTPEYFAKVGENGGYLLKHGVGNMPNKTEIDTPLTYGDYYLIEAMKRYKSY
ncbi:glycoside hydrolase family 88 protein [Flavobacterium sp. MAH-1]|uniref:Glycoside hydrolase family 88 protein n=1 Tax=Flavobacterium agri TaxID=2743471 RepID=A0A7Y8Y428_9FLAO|nr:glycoside hydrolase family 76 protein [Flavobacterium agri]NUY82200.1 glycoside hydrolase family 88 protein [Flavobacterium agri]NYA72224.1 glycoside hydrolase family 88 protein [Flavobacterium agri]